MVPNPAKREAHQKVKTATATVEREQAAANARLLAARTPAPGQEEVLITSDDHNEITQKWRAAAEDLATAATEHALTPTRVALGELSPGQQVLNVETKLLTARSRSPRFDIDPRTDGELRITLDPMPTARETAAIAELGEHLTATQTRFPGTDRLLRYQIKTSR